jgi:hypothetical protein
MTDTEIKALNWMDFSPKLDRAKFQELRKEGRVYAYDLFRYRWVEVCNVQQNGLGNWQTSYRVPGSWDATVRMGLFPLWLCSDSTEHDWKVVVRLHMAQKSVNA